jgi:hypothetical protein
MKQKHTMTHVRLSVSVPRVALPYSQHGPSSDISVMRLDEYVMNLR